MQRTISKFGRYAAPAACALALGACFHPTPQEAVAPSGRYGGTVVAYPAGGYGYDPYAGYYGYAPYGYAPLGYAPYGYGYAPYGYVAPRVIVRPPAYRHPQTVNGNVSEPRHGQYGLQPWNGQPRTGQLRPPVSGVPVNPSPRHAISRTVQPRPAAPAPRPTVIRTPQAAPRARIAVPRPAPPPPQRAEQRPEQRPEHRH